MAEDIAELEKQKEDIEILLSTLEEAYREASITEKHYNEVKGKNQKKLEDIKKRIAKLEQKVAKASEKEAKAQPKPVKAKPQPKAEPQPQPETRPQPKTEPQPQPETQPQPSQPSEEYSGIPQALTEVAGEGEAPASPDKAPGRAELPKGIEGTVKYTAQEIKEMLKNVLKEIRPEGIEVAPRVDKLEVQLEKMRAYIEAMKDERTSGKEGLTTLNEQIGELRSSVSTMDRKLSETEAKAQEADGVLAELKPDRFTKKLTEMDKEMKMHSARLEKTDDLTSVILKRIGQLEEVLKKLGSLEKIVNFSREAAKRLVEIENREKRIGRVADKIDGIFMELNKRLDEFVLYRAKQDTLDELSQEMMKSLDDINTKVEKYAEKGDLDSLRGEIEGEIASIRSGAGASPEVQKLQAQKTEIEGLIAMLDEQFKAKAITEQDYTKSKNINETRLKDIEKKIAEASTNPAPSPEQWKAKATGRAKTGEAKPGAGQGGTEGKGETGAGQAGSEDKGATKPAEKPESKEGKPGEKPDANQGAKEEGKNAEKPESKEDASAKPGKAEPKPKDAKPGKGEPQGPAGAEESKPEEDKTRSMLSELEDSLMKGLISREAYEKAKKLVKK